MKIFIISVALTFSFIKVFAQKKYEPGFIITIDRDTVNGFLLDAIDASMVYGVEFKKTSQDFPPTKIKSSELLGFGFDNGRTFDRLVITELTGDSSIVLVKKIIAGRINLWVLRHKKRKSDIFLTNIASNNNVHLTPPQKSTIVASDGKKYTKKDQKYLGLLNYIKSDHSSISNNSAHIKYSEKKIIDDILEYNKIFHNSYPLNIYKEKIKYYFDFVAGIPIIPEKSKETSFRAGIYIDKTYPEKSRIIAFSSGITYRYWNDYSVADGYGTGNVTYRTHLINALPLGIKFQTNRKLINFYCFMGIGIGIAANSKYEIVNSKIVGSKNNFFILPAVNFRVGTDIKIGTKSILLEITPAPDNLFFNIGFSF